MTKKKIYRAGVIPFIIHGDMSYKMLFMKPSREKYGGRSFQIAKGKREKIDMSIRDTAIREAYEELGLKMSNVLQMWELGTYLGRTTIFVAKVCSVTDFDKFGNETSEIKWMGLNEYVTIGRKLHIPVITDAVDYIIKKHS